MPRVVRFSVARRSNWFTSNADSNACSVRSIQRLLVWLLASYRLYSLLNARDILRSICSLGDCRRRRNDSISIVVSIWNWGDRNKSLSRCNIHVACKMIAYAIASDSLAVWSEIFNFTFYLEKRYINFCKKYTIVSCLCERMYFFILCEKHSWRETLIERLLM